MAQKFLIINPFGVGDVLFSTPLVSAIKRRDSNSYIGYICNIRTQDILRTNPEIDEVFVFERDEYRDLWKQSKIGCIKKLLDFWRNIKKRQFDKVIDLSLGKEYAFFCWLIGIKERDGFNYRGRGRFLTHKIRFDGFNEKPVAEYYLGILGFPVDMHGLRTILVFTDEDEAYIDNFLREKGIANQGILVGIAPGGGISFGSKHLDKRRWGVEKFSKLADRIIRDFNAAVVLIWGPEEEKLVKDIQNLMEENVLIAPQTKIRQMAALCKRCGLVICSEGGPLHIASSQGTRTISIFGPVNEKVYGPYPQGEDNVVLASPIECRPCYSRFKLPECDTRRCIEAISVDTVLGTVSLQLNNAGIKLRGENR